MNARRPPPAEPPHDRAFHHHVGPPATRRRSDAEHPGGAPVAGPGFRDALCAGHRGDRRRPDRLHIRRDGVASLPPAPTCRRCKRIERHDVAASPFEFRRDCSLSRGRPGPPPEPVADARSRPRGNGGSLCLAASSVAPGSRALSTARESPRQRPRRRPLRERRTSPSARAAPPRSSAITTPGQGPRTPAGKTWTVPPRTSAGGGPTRVPTMPGRVEEHERTALLELFAPHGFEVILDQDCLAFTAPSHRPTSTSRNTTRSRSPAGPSSARAARVKPCASGYSRSSPPPTRTRTRSARRRATWSQPPATAAEAPALASARTGRD